MSQEKDVHSGLPDCVQLRRSGDLIQEGMLSWRRAEQNASAQA